MSGSFKCTNIQKEVYLKAGRHQRRPPSDNLNNKMEDHPIDTLNSLWPLFYVFMKGSACIKQIDDLKQRNFTENQETWCLWVAEK